MKDRTRGETPMETIPVKLSPLRRITAEVLPELPQPGDKHHSLEVLAVCPRPLTHPQGRLDAYAYALWALHVKRRPLPLYVAVHEPEGEQL